MKPKVQQTEYLLKTDIGDVTVTWTRNGPAEINGTEYKSTWMITAQRTGPYPDEHRWIARSGTSATNAVYFATLYVNAIKGETTLP